MSNSPDKTGKEKYDLRDPLPGSLPEVRQQIEYWMSRQNEGQGLSDWEIWVKNKIDQLRWKEQQLLPSDDKPSKQPASPDAPVIFLSCGQYSEEEKNLGKQVKALLEASGTPEVYFAEYQSTFEGLTNNILGALNRCVAFIGIMHYRGQIATPGETIIRASVWIEQEIAVAAFIQQIIGRKIEVQLYIQDGISREGMRDKLMLNSQSFKADEEVLEHLRQNINRWRALNAGTRVADQAFEKTFKERLAFAKGNFYIRVRRPSDGQHVRSSTHFWTYLFPVSFERIQLDVNIVGEFSVSIYKAFRGHEALARHQNKGLESEVPFAGARELALPILSHGEERRWRLTQQGEIGFATQSVWALDGGPDKLWSAYDLAQDILSLLDLASSFWGANGYAGAARLVAELKVGPACLANATHGYPALFYQQTTALTDAMMLDRHAILPRGESPQEEPRGYALAQHDFQVASLLIQAPDVGATVLAQLITALGHEIDMPRLRRSMQSLF